MTGYEYLEKLNGQLYYIKKEAEAIEIEIKPGLLARIVAAKAASEKNKIVIYKMLSKEFVMLPEEATKYLEGEINDV